MYIYIPGTAEIIDDSDEVREIIQENRTTAMRMRRRVARTQLFERVRVSIEERRVRRIRRLLSSSSESEEEDEEEEQVGYVAGIVVGVIDGVFHSINH